MCGPASFRREEPLPSTQNIMRELAIPYSWMQSAAVRAAVRAKAVRAAIPES